MLQIKGIEEIWLNEMSDSGLDPESGWKKLPKRDIIMTAD